MSHETHNVCNEMLAKHGGKAECCDCTGHECSTVKMGYMEAGHNAKEPTLNEYLGGQAVKFKAEHENAGDLNLGRTCNQCKVQMDYHAEFSDKVVCVCIREECPNYGLLQIALEKMPK